MAGRGLRLPGFEEMNGAHEDASFYEKRRSKELQKSAYI